MAGSLSSAVDQIPDEAVPILCCQSNKPRPGNQHIAVISQGVTKPPMKESR